MPGAKRKVAKWLALGLMAAAAWGWFLPSVINSIYVYQFQQSGLKVAAVPIEQTDLLIPPAAPNDKGCAHLRVSNDALAVVQYTKSGNRICYSISEEGENQQVMARRNADGTASFYCQQWPAQRIVTSNKVPLLIRE